MTVTAEIVALIAAAVAVFAAVLAIRATALIARTVTAGDPAPGLGVTVTSGKTRRTLATDTRDYAFSVVFINRTGVERQIARAELRVAYRTRANFLGAVDLVTGERVSVPAGRSVDALLRFSTSNVIPRHCRVDAYTLFLFDDRGERIVADASLPEVLKADTDGEGPKNWGWD